MEWKTKKLSEVCEKITDGTHQTPKYFESGHIFLSSKNVTSGKIDWDNVRYIDDVQHVEMQKRISPRVGDILLAKNGTTGVAAIVDREVCFDIYVSLAFLRSLDFIDSTFLLYFINSPIAKKQFNKRLKGIGVPNLHLKEIRDVRFSYPSKLPEQKRIVTILDLAFADIEKARANAEQNLKNARELFESYLQKVFSQRGDGWGEVTLGAEIELLTGFAFKSKEYVSHSNSIKLIRGDNIIQGRFRWGGVKQWPIEKVKEFEKYLLENNDIVLAMDRTWVKTGIKYAKITDMDTPCLLVQRVARLRCMEALDVDYLYFLIGSKFFEDYVLSIQTGLGVPHISGKQIQSFIFQKPSLKVQKEIIIRLKALSAEIEQLTKIYQEKLNTLDELKKSILQKAFTGELTKEAAT